MIATSHTIVPSYPISSIKSPTFQITAHLSIRLSDAVAIQSQDYSTFQPQGLGTFHAVHDFAFIVHIVYPPFSHATYHFIFIPNSHTHSFPMFFIVFYL